MPSRNITDGCLPHLVMATEGFSDGLFIKNNIRCPKSLLRNVVKLKLKLMIMLYVEAKPIIKEYTDK